MEQLLLFSIAPDDLRSIITGAVNEALETRQTEEPPPRQPEPDEYLSRDEVRKMLRLSFPTLRNLELRGELVPVRIARRVLYRRRDVEAALVERRTR